jgi:hypothetical protein
VKIEKVRGLPNFIIIGAQKSGTTSLYFYLQQHPKIRISNVKEIHYFTKNYNKAPTWYFDHFEQPEKDASWITGEATPMYLFDPRVPKRMRDLLPDVKIIVLLRNPVDRAYSHFQHEVRLGNESRPLMTALEQEPAIMRRELQRVLNDPNYFSTEFQSYSYLARGYYADQLRRFKQYYPSNQILILRSEDLFNNPGWVLEYVLRFLGVHQVKNPGEYPRYNYFGYKNMALSARLWLRNHFVRQNKELYQLIGRDMEWDKDETLEF